MDLKTKHVLSNSTLEELIGFEMMMSTIRVNSFGGKLEKTTFCFHIFNLSPYTFIRI